MAKQVFDGNKVTIVLDEQDPREKAELLRKTFAGKALTVIDKAKLFDAYVGAGIIKI